MMFKGIVGHAAEKFTPITERAARGLIGVILQPKDILVSGRCHLSGIDVWAEDIADILGNDKLIFPARIHQWGGPGGYKERNLKIAEISDVVHVIVVAEYPPNFKGMTFDYCYHCHTKDHIKSGACWTARKAMKLYGKGAIWYIINPDGSITTKEYEATFAGVKT